MSIRQVGPDHMNCKDPECSNAEFWITRDGLVICSDDECFAEYGRLAEVGTLSPEEIAKLQDGARLLGRVVTSHARAMEAARIELAQGDARKAMEWILNSLPDVDDNDPEDQWNGTETAREWFDRTDERTQPAGAQQ